MADCNKARIDYSRQGILSCQSLGWYHTLFGGDRNAEAALSFLERCGFNALDYHFEGVYTAPQIRDGMLSPVFDMPTEALLEYYTPLKQAKDAHGFVISQAHGISPRYVLNNPEMNTYLQGVLVKMLDVCRFLECPYLVLHPVSGLSAEEDMRLLGALIPYAVRAGVTICIENMFRRREDGNTPFYDAPTTCRIIDQLNAEAGGQVFGACYDTGHANITGRDFYEDVCMLGDRLKCLHIHDNNGIRDLHLLPYTQKRFADGDNADWDGLWKGLAEIGYTGPVNFEIHPALRAVPAELMEDLLKLAAAMGRYILRRIDRTPG